MFKATFKDDKQFSNIINVIKDLINDTKIYITGNGLHMSTMDANHICLCKFNLDRDLFSEFLCDEKAEIGFNINIVSKILNCSSNIDSLSLELENEDSDKIKIYFTGDYSMTFNINLINLENSIQNIDDSNYNNCIKLESKKFNTIIKDLQIIGDTIELICENNNIIFKTTGDNGELEIKLIEDDTINIQNNESYSDKFSLVYLSTFTKALAVSNFVTLKLLNNSPMIVEFYINETEMSYLKFYLAPKI